VRRWSGSRAPTSATQAGEGGTRLARGVANAASAGRGDATLNQLAQALVLDRSGLGHSLRPLQRDGLIRLDKSTDDRRSTHVALTPEGRRRYKRAFPRWQQAQNRVAAIIGQPAANELRSQLIDIAADDRLR
jgi:DNA-binding MarR family transcriptional regulator